jgi:hypothetical protein
MVRSRLAVWILSMATFVVGAGAARAAPAAPGSAEPSATAPTIKRSRAARLVSPVFGPMALKPPSAKTPEPLLPSPPPRAMAEAAVVPSATDTAGIADTVKSDAAAAVMQSSDQLDKFHKIYESATKIFGAEHTVITPLFFVAGDINGRLSTTQKREAGLSATLLVPIFGAGGGHGPDWFPVVTSSDETKIYSDFLDQLAQYQSAEENAKSLGADVDAIAHTKWNVQNLLLAKQIFCKEDISWPDKAADAIEQLCKGKLPTTLDPTKTDSSGAPKPSQEQQLVIDAVTPPATAGIVVSPPIVVSPVPQRHNLMIGPSLGIPLTKNPTDIFQLGASAELGCSAFRFMATGGLVGQYQGATFKDVFAAGWFVGLALSGQLGDELFHFFNGGSDLLNQLAEIKNNPTPAE